MKKIAVVLLLAVCFWKCSHDASKSKLHGGCLHVNEFQKFNSLLPIEIDEINNYHIASQIYEGLVRFDNKLQVIPAIAESWTWHPEELTYQFNLRSNVFFHNDPCFADGIGRKVTAADVAYCFTRLCTNVPENRQYTVTFKDKVKGAKEVFSGEASELSGVRVINDSTLKVQLLHDDRNFINVLAMAGCFIYPKEAVEKYGADLANRAIGTGPFTLTDVASREHLCLSKNVRYWGRDEENFQLPYLDTICWTFETDRSKEFSAFRNNKLDMIYRIPSQELKSLFDAPSVDSTQLDFDVFSSPALSVTFYGFNLAINNLYANKNFRKALNYAIDREAIIEDIHHGFGMPAGYGIVPYAPAFENAGLTYKSLHKFRFDPDSAKYFLEKAGFAPGQKLPVITLDVNDGNAGRNIQTAMKISAMVKQNLGLTINLNVVNWQEHINQVQLGHSDFFRYTWVCDYPDPENFLAMFYGKNIPADTSKRSYVNLTRFSNKKFDELFEAAKLAKTEKERLEKLAEATNVLNDEAPYIPIFYGENLRVVKKYVKNLQENAMNNIDFRTAYIVR